MWWPVIDWNDVLRTAMLMATAAASVALWFYATGKRAGAQESDTTHKIAQSSHSATGLTEVVQRELKRVESQGEAKADAKALIAVEERLTIRINHIDSRLNEVIERTDKRFDAGTERMSHTYGKVTEMVDHVRTELTGVRERMARVEERLPPKVNNHD